MSIYSNWFKSRQPKDQAALGNLAAGQVQPKGTSFSANSPHRPILPIHSRRPFQAQNTPALPGRNVKHNEKFPTIIDLSLEDDTNDTLQLSNTLQTISHSADYTSNNPKVQGKIHGSNFIEESRNLPDFPQQPRNNPENFLKKKQVEGARRKAGSQDDEDFRPTGRIEQQIPSAAPGGSRKSLKRASAERATPITEPLGSPLDAPLDIDSDNAVPERKRKKWGRYEIFNEDHIRKRGPSPTVEYAQFRGSGEQYEPVYKWPPPLTEKEHQDRICFETHLKDLKGPPVTIANFVDGSTPSTEFRFLNDCMNAPDVQPLGEEWIIPCECKHDDHPGGCEQTDKCECILNSDNDLFPYYGNGQQKGCLTAKYGKSGDHIYECTPKCPCKGKCGNTKVALGRNIPLEIFKTQDRGWGLRCPMGLRRGEFIDTYRGERITDAEADKRGTQRDLAGEHDKYFFDLDKFKPPESITRKQFLDEFPHKLAWHRQLLQSGGFTVQRDEASGDELWANPSYFDWEEQGQDVVIDGRDMGGPTRWVNHSCNPNCHIMTASTIHADKRVYHLAFFTLRQVKPYEELTFDYKGGYDDEIISDEKAERLSRERGYPVMRCLCGAEKCRRYFFE